MLLWRIQINASPYFASKWQSSLSNVLLPLFFISPMNNLRYDAVQLLMKRKKRGRWLGPSLNLSAGNRVDKSIGRSLHISCWRPHMSSAHMSGAHTYRYYPHLHAAHAPRGTSTCCGPIMVMLETHVSHAILTTRISCTRVQVMPDSPRQDIPPSGSGPYLGLSWPLPPAKHDKLGLNFTHFPYPFLLVIRLTSVWPNGDTNSLIWNTKKESVGWRIQQVIHQHKFHRKFLKNYNIQPVFPSKSF